MKAPKAPMEITDEEHGTKQADNNASAITMSQDPSSDYILVSNAPIASSFHTSWRERYGTHMLIWMCFATCLWGANLLIIVAGMEFFPNMIHSGDVTLDATLVVCIPFVAVWATAAMWSAYKKKSFRWALVLSAIPVVLIIWILLAMGI